MFDYLAEPDLSTAERARAAIEKAFDFLQTFPVAWRKATSEQPFLREMVIEFGEAAHVAPYEIEDGATVSVLAARDQREDDFY
jgi:plasmid stabilization system protein ParE